MQVILLMDYWEETEGLSVSSEQQGLGLWPSKTNHLKLASRRCNQVVIFRLESANVKATSIVEGGPVRLRYLLAFNSCKTIFYKGSYA